MRFSSLGICLVWLLAACAGAPRTPMAARSDRLSELHVITSPVGLNVDGKPGVDGFSLKVYANDARNPKTVPITSGQLEVVAFDGTLYGKTNVPAPLKIWNFSSAELKGHQIKTSIGAGYDFLLLWGTNRPTQRLITIVARHLNENNGVLISDRASVTVLE